MKHTYYKYNCSRPITEEEEDRIYKQGNLDFRDGKWVDKHNYPRSYNDLEEN